MKRVIILGSTGSIGINTLKVISRHPDRFRVVGLTCDSNFDLLAKQAKIFRPRFLGIRDTSKISHLKNALGYLKGMRIFGGDDGIEEIAALSAADIVVMGISGNASLLPLVRAIETGKDIALASKEPLVSAGPIIMRLAKKKGVKIIPVDSEHSAIFQCIAGQKKVQLKKIYLTGTGGPLRTVKHSIFDNLPIKKVLAHPKWKMGRKITVDSASLMNKGLEVIEAKALFGITEKDIEVLVHPEAIIHSMVEFIDGALLAQLGMPDMRLPIQFALGFPDRLKSRSLKMDFSKHSSLTFHTPDHKRFPCLSLAYEASRRGGSLPAVLNASNEVAVNAYLNKRIRFTDIPKVVERSMKDHKVVSAPRLKDILEADTQTRNRAKRIIERY